MKRLFNSIVWLAGLIAILYVFFFVQVGRRTLFGHTMNIAATPEAQELGEDLHESVQEIREQAREQRRQAREDWERTQGGEPQAEEEAAAE